MDWSTVGPVLAIVAAPLLAYVTSQRATAGRAERLQAALRDEAATLRGEHRAEAERNRAEAERLRVRLDDVDKKHLVETTALRARIEQLEVARRVEVAQLQAEAQTLRRRLEKYERP